MYLKISLENMANLFNFPSLSSWVILVIKKFWHIHRWARKGVERHAFKTVFQTFSLLPLWPGVPAGDYLLCQHCFPTEAQLSFNLLAPTVCKHQAWEQQCHCSTTYTSLLNLTGLLISTHHQQFVKSKASRGQMAAEDLYAHREHSTQEGY